MIDDGKAMPCALTVAGSDSGGGAGVQADLRTFSFSGVFGVSAIAAVTSQNPAEVVRVDSLSPESVVTQMETVLSRLEVGAAKTGMLFSSEIIEAVVNQLSRRRFMVVSDPVMVSTSGARLLEDAALEAVKTLLLPAADVITPNIPEAELIMSEKIESLEGMVKAASQLSDIYSASVVLKGGHALESGFATDVVSAPEGMYLLRAKRIDSMPHAGHGTGCTFSASLAASFARGFDVLDAMLEAKAFVTASLLNARLIGSGIYAMFPPERELLESTRKNIELVKL